MKHGSNTQAMTVIDKEYLVKNYCNLLNIV